jgi:hypothetical protein
MKRIIILAVTICTAVFATAQGRPTDTVIVELAKTSKVVFTIKDRSDLETLKQYDFQALFNDILTKIENKDTAKVAAVAVDTTKEAEPVLQEITKETWDDEDDEDDRDWNKRRYRHHGTHQSFNFDLGINNFLEKGKFPDEEGAQYAVRPWGSWYIGLNSIQRTRVSNNFSLEWGVGVSWYNFKFQDAGTIITKTDSIVSFTSDPRDVSSLKSKLTVTYINASLIPVFDFGGYHRRNRFWNSDKSAFRIGVGPYVGYRIGSRAKLVYKEDGDREKDKDRNNFYLNNLRYGMRLQLGVRSADFFFNYDMSELFAANKGPKLNAFSFGVIF